MLAGVERETKVFAAARYGISASAPRERETTTRIDRSRNDGNAIPRTNCLGQFSMERAKKDMYVSDLLADEVVIAKVKTFAVYRVPISNYTQHPIQHFDTSHVK